MSLKLVPFNEAWISHDKLDVHAIYRRPRWVEDQYGDMHRENKDGIPTWDLTGPLPVRQHNKWRAKGFEYVTLADRISLICAYQQNTLLPPGAKVADYDQHTTGGPWNFRRYIEGQDATTTLESEQLRADVEEFGSAAVEAIRRRHDPSFTLPEPMRNIPPRGSSRADEAEGKGKKKAAEVA